MQDRFKQLLEEKNLTATKFAALIKVNASAMSHILNGRSKPGFDVLDKIGQAFPDINLNWLISGKGEMCVRAGNSKPIVPPQQENNNGMLAEEKGVRVLPQSAPVLPPALPEVQEQTEAAVIPPKHKKIKRIILFFEDGSFEDYDK